MKQLNEELRKANQSDNRGTTVTQGYKRYGSGAATGEGRTDTKFNLKLAQLREATNAYSGVRDTAMNFSRKSLASGYVAAVRAGTSVYNLYFRLCSGFATYSDVLRYVRASYLFQPQSNDQTASGGSVNTFKVRKKNIVYMNDDDYSARHAYLFSEYVPTDPNQYKTGVRLPPIMHAAINYDVSGSIPEFKIYKKYYNAMAGINVAIQNTYPMQTAWPRQNCTEKYWDGWLHKSRDIFCGGIEKGKNWHEWIYSSDITRMKQVASMGLFHEQGTANWTAMSTRLSQGNTSTITRLTPVSTTMVPHVSFSGFMDGVPKLIRIELIDNKARIDSTVMLDQSHSYVMGDNKIVYWPELTYSVSWNIVDEATPAMFADIKAFNSFFQSLVDFGLYMHSRGFSHKKPQVSSLMAQSRCYNPLSISGSPLTFSKSILGTWWINSFITQFGFNERLGEVKRSYYKAQPFIPRDKMVEIGGDQSLYWQDYVLHISRIPTEVSKTKGTVFEDLFKQSGNYYDEHDFTWFCTNNTNGIVGKNTLDNWNGNRNITLDLYWFSPNNNDMANAIGKLADNTKETITNSGAKVLIVTNVQKQYGCYSYKIGTKNLQVLKDNNGLKFRTSSDSGNNWWE